MVVTFYCLEGVLVSYCLLKLVLGAYSPVDE